MTSIDSLERCTIVLSTKISQISAFILKVELAHWVGSITLLHG